MDEREWLESEDPAALLEFFQRPAARPMGPDRPMLSERRLRLFSCACADLFGLGGHYGEEGKRIDRPAAEAANWAHQPTGAGGTSGLFSRAKAAAILREIAGNPFRAIVLPPGPCMPCKGSGEVPSYTGMYRLGSRSCKQCGGTGKGPCSWLTPTVVSLAQVAYDERSPGRKCERCKSGVVPVGEGWDTRPCPDCNAKGRIEDGFLDPARLGILADALEEAGCAGEACGKCKGEGKTHWQPKNDREDMEFRYMTHAGYRREDWMEKCEACDGKGRFPHPLLEHLRSAGPHWRGCHALDILLGKD